MSQVHRAATRLRWPLTLLGWLLWWLIAPPTSTGGLLLGCTVLIVGHRMLAPRGVRARRRATLRTRVALLTVIGFLYGTAAPQAFAAAPDWGIPSNEDYCKYAPSPETSGSGITGILDPQSGIRLDGTIYGDRGYAGLFWFAYDPGCASAAGDYLLGPLGGVAFDSNGAPSDTAAGNLLLSGAKIGLAAATGMRARALDPTFFTGLDGILLVGVNALRDLFITPWLGLPLMLLGLILLVLAHRGDHSESAHRAGVGLAALAIIAFLGQYPLQAAQRLDRQVVDFEQSMELGFIAKLPDNITPITQGCVFDFSQFSRPPTWNLTGEQVVSAVYCTEPIRPTLTAGDADYYYDASGQIMHYDLDYFRNHYVPEVLVAELIFPYWQEGLLGTTDRSGPNYDLARSFLLGQSLAEYDIAMQNYRAGSAAQAPVGSVWCTYSNNTRVCGRSETGGVPGQLMTATEERYRASIEAAGPDRYPYIQGRAANRTAAGAKSLAAVAAAAPPLFAAYTGVFAGRLLLRIFVFAGLIMALALFLFPKLLRRMLGTVGSALATILMLAVMGALMTFLTLQLVANPAVFGSIGPTGGMIILAVISVLSWLAVKPMRRIGAMLSTAAFNNPQALSNTRRKVTGLARGGVNRVLRRRPVTGRDLDRLYQGTGPGHSGDPAGMPAEPSRPRPEGLAVAPAKPARADRPTRAVEETPARARTERMVIHPTVKPRTRTAEPAAARTNAPADIYRPSLTTPSRRQLTHNPAAQVPAELIWSPPPPPVPAAAVAAAAPRDLVPTGARR